MHLDSTTRPLLHPGTCVVQSIGRLLVSVRSKEQFNRSPHASKQLFVGLLTPHGIPHQCRGW